MQRRLQEIQLRKQMSHSLNAISKQIKHQQAEKALHESRERAPLQSSNGNISPEIVCPRRREKHESAERPDHMGEKQEDWMKKTRVFTGTPTPPDDEDTPSVGGDPTETHTQADAQAALPTPLTLEAQGTDANDWSSSISQPAGEADADDSVSVATSDWVPAVP